MKMIAVALTAFLALAITAAPADAKADSGWGCGGACRVAGR